MEQLGEIEPSRKVTHGSGIAGYLRGFARPNAEQRIAVPIPDRVINSVLGPRRMNVPLHQTMFAMGSVGHAAQLGSQDSYDNSVAILADRGKRRAIDCRLH